MSDEPSKAALKQDIDALRDLLMSEREARQELETKVETVEAEKEHLRSRVSTLEDANNLVVDVQQNASGDYARYAAIVLKSLYQEAKDSPNDRAHLKAGKPTVRALQSQIKRANTYDFLRNVEMLADTPAVVFDEEPTPMRLVVNLDEGDVPATIEGHEIVGVSA